MVDPTLGGRIDYREVYQNLDFESLFEGTRFEGDGDGPLAFVGGELGENLGRILGAIAGYLLGAIVLGSSILGGGDDETAADDAGDDQASESDDGTQEAEA